MESEGKRENKENFGEIELRFLPTTPIYRSDIPDDQSGGRAVLRGMVGWCMWDGAYGASWDTLSFMLPSGAAFWTSTRRISTSMKSSLNYMKPSRDRARHKQIA